MFLAEVWPDGRPPVKLGKGYTPLRKPQETIPQTAFIVNMHIYFYLYYLKIGS
jgi:hypothetical protein